MSTPVAALGQITKETGQITKGTPRHFLRDMKRKPQRLGINIGSGLVKAAEEVGQKKHEAAANIAQEKAAGEISAFETQQTKTRQEAARKAREEQIALRRSTPGRPVFTSLNTTKSLLG